MTLALPGFEEEAVKGGDITYTPDDIAAAIVRRFRPQGRILDPCRGGGAFTRAMPTADWCEVRDGRDFFAWREPVDWIVSNPPYSTFAPFLRHSFTVAREIVYLVSLCKLFYSDRLMRDVWAWGGVKTVMVIGNGKALGWPFGYCFGALHFSKDYRGPMGVEFHTPNMVLCVKTHSKDEKTEI